MHWDPVVRLLHRRGFTARARDETGTGKAATNPAAPAIIASPRGMATIHFSIALSRSATVILVRGAGRPGDWEPQGTHLGAFVDYGAVKTKRGCCGPFGVQVSAP